MSLCSDCCGAATEDNSEDYGICLKCGEHCEFYDDDEEECPDCYELISFCECEKETT